MPAENVQGICKLNLLRTKLTIILNLWLTNVFHRNYLNLRILTLLKYVILHRKWLQKYALFTKIKSVKMRRKYVLYTQKNEFWFIGK